VLTVRPESTMDQRKAVVEAWLRGLLKEAIPPLTQKWEPLLGVKAASFTVRRMKTRWGSCNTRDRTIRYSTELATKTPECLDYVVLHELVHLLERSHNARFKGFMDQFMPEWRKVQTTLNQQSQPGSMDL